MITHEELETIEGAERQHMAGLTQGMPEARAKEYLDGNTVMRLVRALREAMTTMEKIEAVCDHNPQAQVTLEIEDDRDVTVQIDGRTEHVRRLLVHDHSEHRYRFSTYGDRDENGPKVCGGPFTIYNGPTVDPIDYCVPFPILLAEWRGEPVRT